MRDAVETLPAELLSRASLRGNEYAWRIEDIPEVIGAARDANLVSVGGQLQFRLPDGGTCECYWVEVDTYKSVPKSLPWNERVTRAAEAAARDFSALLASVDFLAAGREGFAEHLESFATSGGDPRTAMCFVWYALSEDEAKNKNLQCFNAPNGRSEPYPAPSPQNPAHNQRTSQNLSHTSKPER